MTPRALDLELSGFRFPTASDIRRRLVGIPEHHDAKFASQYDETTLFYDCFLDSEAREVLLLGPPLLNFKKYVKQIEFEIDGCPVGIKEIRKRSRCSIVALHAEAGQVLTLKHALFGGTLPIGRSYVSDFAGTNCLYTISLNNRLEWIADWLTYYVKSHGADAVILSDNGSTDYSIQDLQNCLASVPGLRQTAILRARYPFGPTAANKSGYAALFLQRSLAELGRLRFLQKARAVVNADIDELFYSESGRSVFDAAVASETGYLRANAQWVYAPNAGSAGFARHCDHTHISASGRPKANRKWCVVPDGPQQGRQWLTHFLGSSDDPVDQEMTLWHFRQVSTSWKYDRGMSDISLEPCLDLQAEMQRVFR
ncbi:MAG: hypothetical protein AAF665_03920 [Pseudomonadota bacterium]